MAKKYRREAEGAVYPKWVCGPMPDDPRQINPAEPIVVHAIRDDWLDDAERLAREVLAELYPDGPPDRCRPGDDPEIVVDAFAVLGAVESVRADVAALSTLQMHPRDMREWVGQALNDAVEVGRMAERLSIRWRGLENIAAGHQARTANLTPGRRRVEIPPERLRAEWDRARRMRPHADKESLRRVLAERLGKSPATIKRRLREAGIDPPGKKSGK